MAIPNAFYVGFIKEDGHFNLPGITLLKRDDAEDIITIYLKEDILWDTTNHYLFTFIIL
jgi:hypothetical protein